MKKSNLERVTLKRADWREISLALRVLARLIEAEAAAEADSDDQTAADLQISRLRQIAGRFDKATKLEFSFEGFLWAMEHDTATPDDADTKIPGPEPADLRTAAEALRLLAGHLKEAGDQHAMRIGELAESVLAAAEYSQGFTEAVGKLAEADESEDDLGV